MTDVSRDDDFYLWTRQQAAALRALSKTARANDIDWEGVIEEVEDMGKSERNALVSLLTQILAHAYKIENSRYQDPVRSWREEIVNFQDTCNQHMTPSLRRELDACLGEAHRRACVKVRGQFAAHDEPIPELPKASPYSVAELLDPGFNLRPQPKAPTP
ncbi:MAG: DUF29 domain-containing protein [Tagaea sp.]